MTSVRDPRILKSSFVAALRAMYFEYFLLFFIVVTIIFLSFLVDIAKRAQQVKIVKITDNYSAAAYPQAVISPFVINAKAYIVYAPEPRVIINSKNPYFRFSPASTAKVMTALVALGYYRLDTVLTVRNIKMVTGSKMGLKDNETITARNLLYGLLLPSGNDAAAVLAQNYPGGENKFINQMNKTAQELGLKNTKFTDPAGLRDDNYTTAFDLARLSAFALKKNVFATIVKTPSIQVKSIDSVWTHSLTNLNQLLSNNDVTGVKTGFTNEAGGVLITSAVRDGKTYIIVVMKSLDRFADSSMLLNNVVRRIKLLRY